MKSLREYNTFRVTAYAKEIWEITTDEQLFQLPYNSLRQNAWREKKAYILWMWSNTLITKDIDGIVVHIATKWIQIIKEDKKKNEVYIKVAAGEIWDDLVHRTLANMYRWMENLVSIPWTVGAAPIQNIGAYGKEVGELIVEVHCIDKETGEKKIFSNQECKFGYRTSIFKTICRDKYIVSHVVFKLSTDQNYRPTITYKDILAYFQEHAIELNDASPLDVANAIAHIRKRKLPDWKQVWNCGSFFLNPIVTQDQYQQANEKRQHHKLYNWKNLDYTIVSNMEKSNTSTQKVQGENQEKNHEFVKLYAWQLIEFAGYKNIEIDGVSVHQNQSLVIINKSWTATGAAIFTYAQHIIQNVHEIFWITLQPEVNIW